MTVLTAADVAGRHTYLADTRPSWERSMAGIRNEGGPWSCATCSGVSLLMWRCSICGADLAGKTTTHGREDMG